MGEHLSETLIMYTVSKISKIMTIFTNVMTPLINADDKDEYEIGEHLSETLLM